MNAATGVSGTFASGGALDPNDVRYEAIFATLVRTDHLIRAVLWRRLVQQFPSECFAYRLRLLDVLIRTGARNGF